MNTSIPNLPIEIVNKILLMRPIHPLATIMKDFCRFILETSYIFLPNLFVNMRSFHLPDVILKFVINNRIV